MLLLIGTVVLQSAKGRRGGGREGQFIVDLEKT
jgi:hypothetical protein